MLRNCLCTLAGAYALSLCRELPSDAVLVGTITVAAVSFLRRSLRPLGFVLLGLVAVWMTARGVINDRIAPELEGETLHVAVRTLDFPEVRPGSVRFLAAPVDRDDLPQRIRLSWYGASEVPRIGELWNLELRLRRPRGLSNPAGFDYELWLARQRIGASGYVVAGRGSSDMPPGRRPALRQRLVDRMLDLTGDNDASAVLLAVAVGARHRISKEQWERYAVSGTSHLMAISGLHIGLAAGGAWLLARVLCSPFCRRSNVRDIAALTALVAAFAYADVSGFAIPARRALLMSLLVIAAFLLRRELRADRMFAGSCLAILLTDPLAIHAPGFKLSFAAVAILLWAARQRHFQVLQGRAGKGLWFTGIAAAWRLATLQLLLLLGLFPLTTLIFGRVAWIAPAVNLLVLPVFNLVTVPAALAGLLLDGPLAVAGDRLILLAWHSVRGILWLLGHAADWPRARLYMAMPSGLALPVVLMTALWAAAPPGFPGRRIAWLAAAAAVLYRPPLPPPGCADLAVLDVGQGLSLVLQTSRHTLVYDTGPSFQSGSNSGELVLVPYLRAIGAQRVDMLVISHAHDDHAGGAVSLLESFDVSQIMTGGQLPELRREQLGCRSGQAWLRDGVRFTVMHPGLYPSRSKNDGSCVLEIAVGQHRILLPGDIEAAVENHLARSGALSRAEVVIVPHHGSRTSSVAAFVGALQPSVAVVSAGFRNRWGFPKEEVVARWEDAGSRVLTTAESGAIRLRICADGGLQAPSEQRLRQQRYWHDLPG